MKKDVPPKHDRTAPRGWFSLFSGHSGWLSLIVAVICIIMTFWSVAQYRDAAAYDRVGVETQAEAISRRIKRDSERSDAHYVTYRFVVDDIVVQRERRVSSSQYSRSGQGTFHTIRYLPETPRKFETYVGEAYDDAVMLQWVAGFAGLGSLAALWWMGSRTNRSMLTRRYGHRTVARINQIVETKNSGRPSGRGYLVWYTEDTKLRGESLMHPIGKLNAIGVGADINVYVRKGHSVWEGDVGPQEIHRSNVPTVDRERP